MGTSKTKKNKERTINCHPPHNLHNCSCRVASQLLRPRPVRHLTPKKTTNKLRPLPPQYSHLLNKRGGWNKRVGSAKVAKSLNVEAGINVEGGIFWKKLVYKSNKRGVEGGKI